jgi:hypothetical protein
VTVVRWGWQSILGDSPTLNVHRAYNLIGEERATFRNFA